MLRDTYCYNKACFAQTVPVKATETFSWTDWLNGDRW